MEFRDLKSQYIRLRKNIDDAIREVISTSSFIGGMKVNELENKFADYVGVKHCISCANGTDALQLALMAWNIGTGDAVFVPDFTFFSTAEVVVAVGATPVFVDVCKDTFNIDLNSLKKAIESTKKNTRLKIRAVIPVDLFGQPADYKNIKKIADEYGLLVLEDGAQGFGGRIGDRRACSFGDIATTSFFPSKPLGCYGDGGAIFTDSDECSDLLKSYRVHGKGSDKYDNVRIGMNSRLDSIQATILLEKFHIFDDELIRINELAGLYSDCLDGCVDTPKVDEPYYSSWAQYSVVFKNRQQRDKIQKIMNDNGIPSMIYYRKPMHTQKAFFGIENTCPVSYINTEYICDRVLSLPISPYISEQDVVHVSDIIKRSL